MGESVWNVNETKTKWNAHVLILPAQEEVCAVNALPITGKIMNCQGVFFPPAAERSYNRSIENFVKVMSR